MKNEKKQQKIKIYLKKTKREVNTRLNWLKSSPKGLLKCLLVFLLIQYIYTFCMVNIFWVSLNVVVFIAKMMIFIYPLAHLSYVAEVFVLYWLIDLLTSKVKMPAILKWVMNTVILVVATTSLYTISITSQNFSYYTLGGIFKLIFFEIYINYRDIFHVFKFSGLNSGYYFDILYFIGTLWTIMTILVPLYYFIKKIVLSKKPINQVKSDRDNLELRAYQQKLDSKYIQQHGILKPDFSWHRFNIKLLMGLGFLFEYLGAFMFSSLLDVIYWFFGNQFTLGDLLEIVLFMIGGISLGLFGMWIHKRRKKELDLHYQISAYKINWRINICITIVFVLSIILTLILNGYKFETNDYSVVTSITVIAFFTFLNSIRLRRKFTKTLKSSIGIKTKITETNVCLFENKES